MCIELPLLLCRTLSMHTIVVHPQQSREDETKWREAQRSSQAQEVVQDGHCFSYDKAQYAENEVNAQPRTPVDDRILLQMARVSKEAHEDVFGCDVLVDTNPDNKTGEGDAIADFLEQCACATESWCGEPDAAVAVDDQAKGQVHPVKLISLESGLEGIVEE